MRAIQVEGKVYLVAIAGKSSLWLKNIASDARVELRLKYQSVCGRARPVTDPAELDRARLLYCEPVDPFDYVECLIHRRGVPRSARITDLHRRWFANGTPVVVEPASDLCTRE